jgi:hypothetical protein
MRNASRTLTIIACVTIALCGGAWAQESNDQASNLAKAAQNPLAAMTTLPLQFNWNTGAGEYDRTAFNLNVQPVIPFQGEKWNIIARAIMPIVSVPQGEVDSTFGIGDTNLTLFWTPAETGKVIWGVGPIFELPTASNPEVLGAGKFGIGPSAVFFIPTGHWTMGAVISNTWSVAGESDRADTNKLLLQYFVNYNIGGGWAIGTAPIITADWKVESGQRWTVPWGLQISKVTHFGMQPVNLMLGYYSNTTRPDGAAEDQIRFQVNFLFPHRTK